MPASLQLNGGMMTQRLVKLPSAAISFRAAVLKNSFNSGARHIGVPSLLKRGNVRVKANLYGFESLGGHATASFPSLLDHIAAGLTTALFLADVDPSSAGEAAAATADAAAKKGGFLSFFSDSFESFLKLIDTGLDRAGVPYSYGFAIILLTLLVKLGTYPLSAKQVESTLSMQSLQPRVKELQAKYANDPERLQVETAKMYQTAGVNPLAGCLPTLVTIPVFIGLYRALSNVADEGLLTDGFFWIPSLAGPTKLNGGLGWLSLGEDGVPPLGWHDTIAYLILPVLLVLSQWASQKIISPQQSTDPAQQQTQNILKFIPLMIGWFSLNVPSGLTLYWFTNNIVTTAQQVYLRGKFATPDGQSAGSSSGTYVAPKSTQPEERKPSGKELNARRSASKAEVIDVEAEVVSGTSSSTPSTSSASNGSSSGSRGEKFRAIKAREAARKAAAQAGAVGSVEGSAAAAAAAAAAVVSVKDDSKAMDGGKEGSEGIDGGSRGKKGGKKGKKK